VTILDEDIPEDQRQLLRRWRFPVRRIGVDVGRRGMKDTQILSLLHSLNQPTFFTLDHGFFKRGLCHAGYCLVYLDVGEEKAAEFIRRTLRHQQLNSWLKRRGAVIRIRPGGISLWRLHDKMMNYLIWKR
jgi:hypothetical protein